MYLISLQTTAGESIEPTEVDMRVEDVDGFNNITLTKTAEVQYRGPTVDVAGIEIRKKDGLKVIGYLESNSLPSRLHKGDTVKVHKGSWVFPKT